MRLTTLSAVTRSRRLSSANATHCAHARAAAAAVSFRNARASFPRVARLSTAASRQVAKAPPAERIAKRSATRFISCLSRASSARFACQVLKARSASRLRSFRTAAPSMELRRRCAAAPRCQRRSAARRARRASRRAAARIRPSSPCFSSRTPAQRLNADVMRIAWIRMRHFSERRLVESS